MVSSSPAAEHIATLMTVKYRRLELCKMAANWTSFVASGGDKAFIRANGDADIVAFRSTSSHIPPS
jgi:hypothetical protein